MIYMYQYINPLHSEPSCGLSTSNSATAFLESVELGIVLC